VSLARALSKLGACSRKQAEGLIAAGRVAVGGQVVTAANRRVDLALERVALDGKLLRPASGRWVVALHKPVGYVTTRSDPGGRRTVYDLLTGFEHWVFPVGRLDRDSSGLLILTDDHRLGQTLTDPDQHVPKTYHARVRGLLTRTALEILRTGVPLGDGTVSRPARARVLGGDRQGSSWLEIVLTEGRNRQVRRMCAAVGHDVLQLTRVKIGALALGDLPSGAWRRLETGEVRKLMAR
jgi:23S rRNA pseudouridine2605 synthase